MCDWKQRLASLSGKGADLVRRHAAASGITVSAMQQGAFNQPWIVEDSWGLEVRVPGSKNGLTASDIRAAVGMRRHIEVDQCNAEQTQPNGEGSASSVKDMTLKEWQKYFDEHDQTKERECLMQITTTGLDIAGTRLDPQVQSPRIVRQIDWIDRVWPRHLKDMQLDLGPSPTNSPDEMMYPKVQKLCIMSVAKCFTDFNIHCGGSSAWYHLCRGKKSFMLIPPTEQNLKHYEHWVNAGRPANTFLADKVEACARVDLTEGLTLLIPSGWMMATYTEEDSIIFGGLFLHSYSIEKQLQISHLEEVLRLPSTARFPFFIELLWYTLERYIHCLVGRSHLDLPEEEKRRVRLEKGENVDPNQEVLKLDKGQSIVIPSEHVHLTTAELLGLRYIIMYLHLLPMDKKCVPVMIPDPIAIVKEIRALVLDHKDDSTEKSITGKTILRWSENDDIRPKAKKLGRPEGSTTAGGSISSGAKRRESGARIGNNRKTATGNRRRRVRCKQCSACLGADCKVCVYCRDMTKHGGPGRMKQTCEKRRCLHPQLPVCAFCSICQLDGWFNEPRAQTKEADRPDEPPKLFECTACLDIVHPTCAEKNYGMGKINPDLSNSWECAKCSGNAIEPASQSKKRPGEEISPSDAPEAKRPNSS